MFLPNNRSHDGSVAERTALENKRYLNTQQQHCLDFQRFPGNPMLERHPGEIFHRNEGLVTLPADFVDRANVGGGSKRKQHALPGESVPMPVSLSPVHRAET